jgi:outer membrane protein assembly factor BamA
LAPSSLLVPQGSNIEFVAQSQLIAEAEQNGYTVRRVEFVGNEHTRDMELRRRIPGLQEGEIFRKEILRKNLASLSRLRTIRPVGFDDLEVHLNRNEQTIDLAIFINEQRRAR